MSRKRRPLRGKRVLITGAGSGLGRRLAHEVSARGAHVVVWDLSADAAAATCAQLDGAGGTSEYAVVDVSNEDAVVAAAEHAGVVDVLINNAGIVTGSPLLETPSGSIRRTFDVNVLALYWTTRAVLPGMLGRRRGVIVNIASAAGLVGVAKQTDYSASKFAVVGFTESLRSELRGMRRSGVSTMLVCPYYINTGMFDGVTTKFPRLLPILDNDDVARGVIDRLEAGTELYVTPPLARVVPAARILPSCAFDRLMDFFGINRTMAAFRGRGGR
ncbi:SDR family oxidoreductase [Paramicrobacterium chengjingii]|uniref:SDR family oxidoreductase n=1 Tax=Paramicrobacterium chengjingii TaxID=2769067 RepID=A0ABX6YJ18_9MICO|nr:SDR family oxidoreductase [Microbacterium chengjingii]QPZ38342.1 SDR family oxidoreductase [Microbacterium chengjingii]